MATTPPTGTTQAQKSAKAIIDDFLGQYGLSSLATFAWNEFLHGAPIEQIMLDIRNTPAYKTRFPAMAQLAKEGRAISEAQYIGLEQQYSSIFQSYGLPRGLYDQPADFASYISNDVSPAELSKRVQLASQATQTAPPEVRAEIERLYGQIGRTPAETQGVLTAFFLDPKRAEPVLEQQYQAAAIAGDADRTGYGALSRAQAEQLAALNVTDTQATQGFQQLGLSQQLFNPLPGSQERSITQDQQLAATFGGDATALAEIQRRQAQRTAAFSAGGGFAGTQAGLSGLGEAPPT